MKALHEPIPVVHEPNYNGYYAILVLHSETEGIFQGINLDNKFERRYLVEKELRVDEGSHVSAFSSANNAIGTLFLRFDTREELESALANQKDWLKVLVK